MLTLQVHLADIDADLEHTGKSARFGQSFVDAFVSSQLEMSARQIQKSKEIWIGEDSDPFPSGDSAPSSIDKYRDHSNQEGIKIRFLQGGVCASLIIARTAAGSTPLYVTCDGRTFYASWQFEYVVQRISRPRPNREACRIYLEHGDCQVRDQVIQDVFMLWPGESLTFSDQGLTFEEIGTPDIVLPNTLVESARVTDEFLHLIAESMRVNLMKAVEPIVEVSGGYDSSCVAIAACSAADHMNSYGLIHEGAMGVQQRKRRRELVELLNLNDFEFPSYDHTPLASLEVPECTLTLLDDNHRLPCAYAVDAHPRRGLDLIITGVGGDELTKENTFHRREWEVAGSVCASAIVTAAARADMFMRRGIWPINPLISQSVVNFCRALPAKIRSGRLLNILTLARSGLSDGFLFPRYSEHYGNAMQREASLYDFDDALSESIVADYGITNFSPLLQRARDASHGGFSYKLIFELYTLLKLEKILRRYCG